jgi:hypothetical protein
MSAIEYEGITSVSCSIVGVRFAADSALEERVSSEPVSEVGFLGPGNTARFREVYG